MTFHAFTAYIQYKWRAKSRHGIHSPFVYDFIEQVVIPTSRTQTLGKDLAGFKTPKGFEQLVASIAIYYNCKSICTTDNCRDNKIDLLAVTASKNAHTFFSKHYSQLHSDSVVVVTDIHTTAGHTAGWNELAGDSKIGLSMDLYGIGVLFFKEEFKVKQHFVLRYPLYK